MSILNYTVDLETLGRGDNAPIIQLAIMKFDEDGDEIESLVRNVELSSLDNEGIELSTLHFWLSQKKKVIDSVFNSEQTYPITDCLLDLEGFILDTSTFDKDDIRIWQHSSFDAPKISYSFKKYLKRETYLKYYWFKDIRTLEVLANQGNRPKGNMAHNAFIDCFEQAQWISRCLNSVNGA